MVTIGITTFKERFKTDFVPLANSVAGLQTIVAVNASNKTGLCNEYRADMLSFMSGVSNMSPIFYQQMRGLAKMWNDIIIHSPTEYILMLNDDVQIIDLERLMGDMHTSIESRNINIMLINLSWSHYLVKKSFIMEMGWFDERLLGFGEEDGDMIYRCIKADKPISSLFTNSIKNNSSDVRDEGVKAGYSKYTLFNRVFMGFMKDESINLPPKYIPFASGWKGMFDEPMIDVVPNEQQYPYEAFFLANRDKL